MCLSRGLTILSQQLLLRYWSHHPIHGVPAISDGIRPGYRRDGLRAMSWMYVGVGLPTPPTGTDNTGPACLAACCGKYFTGAVPPAYSQSSTHLTLIIILVGVTLSSPLYDTGLAMYHRIKHHQISTVTRCWPDYNRVISKYFPKLAGSHGTTYQSLGITWGEVFPALAPHTHGDIG